MKIELTPEELETLLESLKYSKQRVADAHGTPDKVRKENLRRLDAAEKALREAGKREKPTS